MQSLLGELSAEEVDAWEFQLATDEAACAALATATRLFLALQEVAESPLVQEVPVEETPTATRSFTPRPVKRHLPGPLHRWIWSLTALSASVLVLVGWWNLSKEPENWARTTTLVQIWRDASPLLRDGGSGDGLEGPENGRSVDLSDLTDDNSESSEVPEWLLAAVSLEFDEANPGRPSDAWEDN